MKTVHIHVHRARDGFEESKHPRASNGEFGTGGTSEKPNSPFHKDPDKKFEHSGKGNLKVQGFEPRKRGAAGDITQALQVAWHYAQETKKNVTLVAAGNRGWQILRPGNIPAFAQPHMVITPEGDVHQYKADMK